jgi:hypothetical protein
MNGLNKALRLLEILYARHVAIGVQDKRSVFCCGCKVIEQDCLMMDEHETWQMYGIDTIEKIRNDCQIWDEFVKILTILNIKVQKEFNDHLRCLENDPNQAFVMSLLRLYQGKNNQALLHVLHDLYSWDCRIDPVESSVEYPFSLPTRYVYYVKGTNETFKSYETNHKKAYKEYLECRLREQFNLL